MADIRAACNAPDSRQIFARSLANLVSQYTAHYATCDSTNAASFSLDFYSFYICDCAAIIACRLRGLAKNGDDEEGGYGHCDSSCKVIIGKIHDSPISFF